MEDKLIETNESYQEEGTHCDEPDEENTEDIGGAAMEVKNDVEDLIENFSKHWNRFGDRVAQEILNNPEDIEQKKCAKASMKILNEVDWYRPLTLRKLLHMVCTELEGKKEKGKKRRNINVQPASVRRSKARATSQKGRKSLGGSGKFKDRSGETRSFILPSGEEIVLPELHQKEGRN